MLFWLVTAMYPQFLITLDEMLEEKAVTVRVGQAVNTVGLAGQRMGISGVSIVAWIRVMSAAKNCRCAVPNTPNTSPYRRWGKSGAGYERILPICIGFGGYCKHRTLEVLSDWSAEPSTPSYRWSSRRTSFTTPRICSHDLRGPHSVFSRTFCRLISMQAFNRYLFKPSTMIYAFDSICSHRLQLF